MTKKLPPLIYTHDATGLTGPSAYLWALFLAREAEQKKDIVAYDKWRSVIDSLKPQTHGGLATSSYYSADFMNAIQEYLDAEDSNADS